MVQAAKHFNSEHSIELAAIGRRVAEVEWDILSTLPW
jgi:hypothetical protein